MATPRVTLVATRLALTVVFWVVPTWFSTTGKAEAGNEQLARGKAVYVKNCAGCHGVEGKGDGYKILGADPANLTSLATKKKSDAALMESIHEGKPNMPSWKVLLSEQESRDVLAYIRTLAK